MRKCKTRKKYDDCRIGSGLTWPCGAYVPHQVTNADRINAMTIEEKADFIYSIAYGRETTWSKPFYEKFCKTCPEPEYTFDDGRKMHLHECDFSDGVCPNGGAIAWWLQQPAYEDDHA